MTNTSQMKMDYELLGLSPAAIAEKHEISESLVAISIKEGQWKRNKPTDMYGDLEVSIVTKTKQMVDNVAANSEYAAGVLKTASEIYSNLTGKVGAGMVGGLQINIFSKFPTQDSFPESPPLPRIGDTATGSEPVVVLPN